MDNFPQSETINQPEGVTATAKAAASAVTEVPKTNPGKESKAENFDEKGNFLLCSGCHEACPFNIICEFLEAVMKKRYNDASVLCGTILKYEPNYQTIKEFEQVLKKMTEESDEESEAEGNESNDSSDDETSEMDSNPEDEFPSVAFNKHLAGSDTQLLQSLGLRFSNPHLYATSDEESDETSSDESENSESLSGSVSSADSSGEDNGESSDESGICM